MLFGRFRDARYTDSGMAMCTTHPAFLPSCLGLLPRQSLVGVLVLIFPSSFPSVRSFRLAGGSCPGATAVQALRAEVESRRVLLANQELSLRERELALERRESDSGATVSRLAAATAAASAAAAQAEVRNKQQEEEADKDTRMAEEAEERQLAVRLSPGETFWPSTGDQDVDAAESLDGVDAGTTAIPPGARVQGAAPREDVGGGKDAPGQPPAHSFRCVLSVFPVVFSRRKTLALKWNAVPE